MLQSEAALHLMSTMTTDDNEQAPPSSAEEAAALLGAAISFDATSYNVHVANSSSNNNNSPTSTASGNGNPPQGMHSIFTVQTPVPNQILFIRLINLRAWLRWHAGIDPNNFELKLKLQLGGNENENSNNSNNISPPSSSDTNQPPFQAARSILAVLQKLLEISSALAAAAAEDHDNDSISSSISSGGMGMTTIAIAAAMSPKLGGAIANKKSTSYSAKAKAKQSKSKSSAASDAQQQQQHKQLPPLLSTPLRHAWVECTALCLFLGSNANLPGNLRTDAHSLLSKMMEISNWNPRSKMASGGVRLSALMVLGKICVLGGDNTTVDLNLAKRVSPYAYEIITCCHKGLLSGGAGEPGHRVECVNTAWKLAVACRRCHAHGANRLQLHGGGGNHQDQSSSSSLSFLATGAMEDRAVMEAIKLIKRATADKYPEVRMGAAVFAGMMAPILIRNIRSSSGTAINNNNNNNMRGGKDGGAASAALDRWKVKCFNMTINLISNNVHNEIARERDDNRIRHHGTTIIIITTTLPLPLEIMYDSFHILPSIGRINAMSSDLESSRCALSTGRTIEA